MEEGGGAEDEESRRVAAVPSRIFGPLRKLSMEDATSGLQSLESSPRRNSAASGSVDGRVQDDMWSRSEKSPLERTELRQSVLPFAMNSAPGSAEHVSVGAHEHGPPARQTSPHLPPSGKTARSEQHGVQPWSENIRYLPTRAFQGRDSAATDLSTTTDDSPRQVESLPDDPRSSFAEDAVEETTEVYDEDEMSTANNSTVEEMVEMEEVVVDLEGAEPGNGSRPSAGPPPEGPTASRGTGTKLDRGSYLASTRERLSSQESGPVLANETPAPLVSPHPDVTHIEPASLFDTTSRDMGSVGASSREVVISGSAETRSTLNDMHVPSVVGLPTATTALGHDEVPAEARVVPKPREDMAGAGPAAVGTEAELAATNPDVSLRMTPAPVGAEPGPDTVLSSQSQNENLTTVGEYEQASDSSVVDGDNSFKSAGSHELGNTGSATDPNSNESKEGTVDLAGSSLAAQPSEREDGSGLNGIKAENFLLKTGGIRHAPPELRENALFVDNSGNDLLHSAPAAKKTSTSFIDQLDAPETESRIDSSVHNASGRSERSSVRKAGSMLKSKLADREDEFSSVTGRSTVASQLLPSDFSSFRKGKKPERIEEIEDGGRILNRQSSRTTNSRAGSTKRQQSKSGERGIFGLKQSSSRLMPAKFLSKKSSIGFGRIVNKEPSDDESDEDDDDDDYEYEESDYDDDDDLANFHVRLEDGSLSEGSYVRVASEYDIQENFLFDHTDADSKPNIMLTEKSGFLPHKQSRMLSHMERITVLDCIVRLLAGTKVTKRIRFKRVRERWIYLGNDLATLNWRSSKKTKDVEAILLKKVRRLQIKERNLQIWTRSYRMTVLLETREEAKSWLTGLVRLIPSTAEVLDGKLVVEMPETYDPLKDSWRGKALENCKRINDYILMGTIGRGSFGKVKLALSVKDKKFYAVKLIADPGKMKRLLLPSERESAARLRKLTHRNIVQHRDILYNEEKQKVVFVLEYMSRGVLQDCSKLENNKPMDEETVKEHMRDVVSGLLYLHQQGIVHRDIKPANLLRSGDGRVKISDFGEAKFYNLRSKDEKESAGVPGTPAFLAPEFCVSANCPRGNSDQYAVDVWSLGASIYYLVFGSVPFIAKSILAMYDAICTEELQFPEEPRVSRLLKDLLRCMLTKSPQKRIGMEGVAAHLWFGQHKPSRGSGPLIEVSDKEIELAVHKGSWIYPKRES